MGFSGVTELPPQDGVTDASIHAFGPQSLIKGKFRDVRQARQKRWLARPETLSQNEIMKYSYARVSTDDQHAGLQLAALKKAGVPAGDLFKDDGISGVTTNRPRLPQEAPAKRHPHSLEARPPGSQPARPNHHARRPQGARRQVPVAYGAHRHRDADRPRHVADTE
jgi:hypothetical protein